MLNLPNFKILDMKENEYDDRLLVETTALSSGNVIRILLSVTFQSSKTLIKLNL